MTLKQAHKRYPLVPDEIVQWALDNVTDPVELDSGLRRLQTAIRIQRRFAA